MLTTPRSAINLIASRALPTGTKQIDGLGDVAAAAVIVARALGRSDALQQSDAYLDAALAGLAERHGLQVPKADSAEPRRERVTRLDAPASTRSSEAIRADSAKMSEDAWRKPTVGVSVERPQEASERRDSPPEPDPAAARAAMLARQEEAWKAPTLGATAADLDVGVQVSGVGASRLDAPPADAEAARVIRDRKAEDAWRRPAVGATSVG